MEIIKPIILFDGDGVLIKSEDPVVDAINGLLEAEGISLRFKAGETGTWRHHYETILAVTGDEKLALKAEQYWFHAETLARAEPTDGAARLLGRIQQSGLESWVATSRDPKLDERIGVKTLEWFERRLPFITPDRIYIREPHDPRGGSEFKGQIVLKLRPKVMIDDDYRTLSHIKQMPGFDANQTLLILMTREWNKREQVDFPRVGNLSEFWEKIVTKRIRTT